jgi:asparagine synthase (glutamine-hydrolysing)
VCGIAGILNLDKSRCVEVSALGQMKNSIEHRGPDGNGEFIDGEIGLVHTRLSIIDLSEKANQPFFSPDNRFSIVFNGEIFNYLELRQSLLARGVKFFTESDTEVLLQLYIHFKELALEMLNGMFAFAIWDSTERTLFIARDRVGVKPLYYSICNNTLYFASEPKAIFAAGLPFQMNSDSVSELILFKYVAGENTIFKSIKRLLPGHFMKVKNSRIETKRWWNLPEKINFNREGLPRDPYEWFENTFYSSVKYRTISDVPVGLMLSGGLDSGSIAAALHTNGETSLSAFTFTFDDALYNEGALARKVAERFRLNLHEVQMTRQTLLESVYQSAWFYDEPLIHQNDAQMLALSRQAKKYVTVLLSGEGGDELMGGYVRYKTLQNYNLLRVAGWTTNFLKYAPVHGIVNRFDKLNRYLKDSSLKSMVMLNASNIYPTDLEKAGKKIDISSFLYRNSVLQEAINLYPDEPARQAMYFDLFVHMPSVLDRNDRMTMGAGIECRVPFMDFRLLEMIPALDSRYLLKGKKGKYLLFNTVGKKLPAEVLTFKKLGFSVPWEKYLREEQLFLDYLSKIENGNDYEVFEGLNLRKVVSEFRKGDTFATAMVRQILMVAIWQDGYVKRIKEEQLN